MAGNSDHLGGGFDPDNSGGWLTGFLAEEDSFDRRSLWRLGSWGLGAVGAVVIAMLANQSSIKGRQDQLASVDLAWQSQQIQRVAKESQGESRRLASAIDTLNGDRDRLYSRVTVLEQGLDTVTGSITRQNSTAGWTQAVPKALMLPEPQASAQNPAPRPVIAAPLAVPATMPEKPNTVVAAQPEAPSVAAVASTAAIATPATPLMASKSMLAPPDPAAAKLSEPDPANAGLATTAPETTGSLSALREPDSTPALAEPDMVIQRTEFGVDLGGANSMDGLRTQWRRLLKSNTGLAALRPIIVVKERSNGLGVQLRLVAGPLGDAAAAARVCAALTETDRVCETSVFDGQRLALKGDDSPAPVSTRPARKRTNVQRTKPSDPAAKPKTSALSSVLGAR